MKTPRSTLIQKKSLCVVLAVIMLLATACSAQTPAQTFSASGSTAQAAPATTETTGKADTAKDTQITEAVTTEPEETEPEETEPAEFNPDPSWPTGSCGADLTWYFDAESGRLTIVGSGAMEDYDDGYSVGYPGWHAYSEEIHALSLPDGLTRIGTWAFQECRLQKVKIPSSVASIGCCAFSNSDLQKIQFSEGLTEIERNAFYGCSLKQVKLPESLKRIGENAFGDCPFTSITIPAGVESFGDLNGDETQVTPFKDNELLEEIHVDPDNPKYSSIDGVLFSKDATTLLRYPCAKPGDTYTVPDGVQEIGEWAFYFCGNLKQLSLPDGLTRIGDYAFNYCESLANLNLPDSLTGIGCEVLTGTCYESMEQNWDKGVLYLDRWLITTEEDLQKVEIREGTVGIADYGLEWGYHSLTSVTIPNSVTYVGKMAFYNCMYLPSVVIPDSVVEIGDRAFDECSALARVTIGSGVKRIGNRAFDNCDALTVVEIPASVTEIGEDAFGYSYRQQYKLVPGFTIHGKAGSAAQAYAEENGFAFVAE